jgi:hypothetical protein
MSSLHSSVCNERCKSGAEPCREAHITVRGGVRWYIGRPLNDPKSPIKSIDCRIGSHAADPESRGRCHGSSCTHELVLHLESGATVSRVVRPGVVMALAELLKSTWSGPMVMHFHDMELTYALGGAKYTKAEMNAAGKLYNEITKAVMRGLLPPPKAAPKKKSVAPKRAITK